MSSASSGCRRAGRTSRSTRDGGQGQRQRRVHEHSQGRAGHAICKFLLLKLFSFRRHFSNTGSLFLQPSVVESLMTAPPEEIRSLAANVLKLSKLLTKDRENLPAAYLKDAALRLAYLRYYLPSNMKKVHLALDGPVAAPRMASVQAASARARSRAPDRARRCSGCLRSSRSVPSGRSLPAWPWTG